MKSLSFVLLAGLALTAAGCAARVGHLAQADAGPIADAGPSPDGGGADAGRVDGGAPDAGAVDAGPVDAGAADAGPTDAGPPDAGVEDAGAFDAGVPDAGPADAGAGLYCDAAPAWAGGSRIQVAAGGDIQAAIDAASPGDTIEVAPGTWTGVELVISKRLRLRAQQPLQTILQGAALPPPQGNAQPPGGAATNGVRITGHAASGSVVEGLWVRWYDDHCFGAEDVTGALFRGNRAESCNGQGFFLYDTVSPEVSCNELLDPYLAGDVPTAVDDPSNANWNAEMDYGVQVYGSRGVLVRNNYFFGQFNQSVSFKEGNRDYEVSHNTFEGFSGTAVLFGQNIAQYGPYAESGQPQAMDTGTLLALGNVLRPAYGLLPDAGTQEYRGSVALRLGHLDQAQVEFADNVIEGAFTGIAVNCGVNSSPGCPSGALLAHGDLINGSLRDASGARRDINYRVVEVDGDSPMAVTLDHESYVHVDHAVEVGADAGSVTLTASQVYDAYPPLLAGLVVASGDNFFPEAGPAGNSSVDPAFVDAGLLSLGLASVTLEPASALPGMCRPGAPVLADGGYVGAVPP